MTLLENFVESKQLALAWVLNILKSSSFRPKNQSNLESLKWDRKSYQPWRGEKVVFSRNKFC